MAVYKKYNGKRVSSTDKNWKIATWWMEFMLKRTRVHKAIPDAKTKDDALAAEASERESVRQGRTSKPIETVTFESFFNDVYLPWAKNNKTSWRHDEFRGRHVIEFFGAMKLDQIKVSHVRRYKEARSQAKSKRGRTYAPASINRELQLLSKVFSLAMEDDLIQSNPLARVPLFPELNKRERFLTVEEEKSLMAVLETQWTYLRPIVIAALNTGLRKTELLKLKFGQCNLSEREKFFRLGGKDRLIPPGYLIVKRKGRHGGKFTLAPINSVVRTELEKIKSERESVSDDDFIFISERTGVDLQEIKKGFRAACEAAGIAYGQNVTGGLTFHDLRRTFATRLRGANVHEFDIAELMGHSSVTMSKNYAQGQLHLMREAVELLSDGKTPLPKRVIKRGRITPTLHQQRKTAPQSR